MKKYQGQNFTILGVNSDSNRKKLKQVLKKENLTWPNWFDKSTSGSISTRWNITGWPTLHLIDHKGIIRFKNIRGNALDKAVEQLMQEMQETP